MPMAKFLVGDMVRHKYNRKRIGVVTKDLGVITPEYSNAPLAAQSFPEQAYMVDFPVQGYTDSTGCWESDLEPA